MLYQKHKQAHPGDNHKSILKIIGKSWRSLSEEEQYFYYKQVEKNKLAYTKDIESIKSQGIDVHKRKVGNNIKSECQPKEYIP